ncbi:MAG: MarR family winged helix-turn-helix transcriptional regulator [Eubacteriales bacterium]|nr:MarR family winged helix-turn-helix transcriptional regulator [Eubacteriales bacterium]
MLDRFSPVMGSFIRFMSLRRYHLQKGLSDFGIHFGQHHILRFIADNEGCTQKEVADLHGVTAASMAQSTKRMQQSGLIEKTADSENLRQNKLLITEKGKKALKDAEKLMDELDKRCFEGFNDSELETLKNYLARMADNIYEGEERNTNKI